MGQLQRQKTACWEQRGETNWALCKAEVARKSKLFLDISSSSSNNKLQETKLEWKACERRRKEPSREAVVHFNSLCPKTTEKRTEERRRGRGSRVDRELDVNLRKKNFLLLLLLLDRQLTQELTFSHSTRMRESLFICHRLFHSLPLYPTPQATKWEKSATTKRDRMAHKISLMIQESAWQQQFNDLLPSSHRLPLALAIGLEFGAQLPWLRKSQK